MFHLIKICCTTAHANDIFQESAFPNEWMLNADISGPIIMILIWMAKEWWDERKGWKKDIKDDLKWLRENVTTVRSQVGDDLDEKIENKVKRAFDIYSHGRGNS